MKPFNIYMTGVGGQGIGLLSQTLLRGIDYAGISAISVDTHGLAQRGGVVVSRIRCGEKVHSPLIMAHQADLVISMEIHEAMRGMGTALKKGGTLVYLDVTWQPLPVRLGRAAEITASDMRQVCEKYNIDSIAVDIKNLPETRMQNMALLGAIANHSLVPGVTAYHYTQALDDLLSGNLLESNLAVFNTYAKL